MTPETNQILNLIRSERKWMDKARVAQAYADAIGPNGHLYDFEAINRAIVERWSLTTLKIIKREAWKLVEKRVA